MSNIEEVLVTAIRQRLVVTGDYQGHQRIMCPHVIGYKDGVLNALFFQFAGGSRSGVSPEGQWRCIHVHELSNVSAMPGEWHSGAGYNRVQTCVDQIIAEVV